jgi:hypothetical protein
MDLPAGEGVCTTELKAGSLPFLISVCANRPAPGNSNYPDFGKFVRFFLCPENRCGRRLDCF